MLASVGKMGDEKRTRVGGHPAALASARWDDEADARRGAPLGASVGKRTLVVRMNYYDKKNRHGLHEHPRKRLRWPGGRHDPVLLSEHQV